MKSLHYGVIVAVIIALALAGCTASQYSTTTNFDINPTVENLFNPTDATDGSLPDPTASGSEVGTKPSNQGNSYVSGLSGFGPEGEFLHDEYGHYLPYDGGEMCMNFMIMATDLMKQHFTQHGVGVLLFLNGQAQPYRLTEGGDLNYCHVIYPELDEYTNEYYFNVYFTPVTGQKGDMVELYATNILYPDWQTSDPVTGLKYTYSCCYSGTRLKYNATPPESEKPEVVERIHTLDIHYEDVPFNQIAGWSKEDLIQKYKFIMYVDGKTPVMNDGYLYDYTPQDNVELRFEIWGTPYVKYGLMFYIDNQPITAQQEICFDMENGQKTIISVTIDLNDFDGECALYAALIPRNGRSTEIATFAFLDFSKTYFLLDDPDPEK